MPREKNESKYAYARTLLESGWSIRKVQEELKRIFGSAISPNILSSMGKEFQHTVELENTADQTRNRYYSHKTSGTEFPSVDLSQIATQFTNTTNKFSEQMEAQNILIKSLITSMQTIQGHLPPTRADSFPDVDTSDSYDITQPSLLQIEFQLTQWLEQLVAILTLRPQTSTQLREKLEIPEILVTICLNHLEMANIIESFENRGVKTYRRRNQVIRANLAQVSKENDNFKDINDSSQDEDL